MILFMAYGGIDTCQTFIAEEDGDEEENEYEQKQKMLERLAKNMKILQLRLKLDAGSFYCQLLWRPKRQQMIKKKTIVAILFQLYHGVYISIKRYYLLQIHLCMIFLFSLTPRTLIAFLFVNFFNLGSSKQVSLFIFP